MLTAKDLPCSLAQRLDRGKGYGDVNAATFSMLSFFRLNGLIVFNSMFHFFCCQRMRNLSGYDIIDIISHRHSIRDCIKGAVCSK
jgi:hypothetical protein